MSVISEHLMLSQEDLELEANLGYIESSRLAWAIETWDSLSEPRGAGIDAKSKRNLLFQCTGVVPDREPQHPFGEFLYGFRGLNRASATRHNMIGGTVHPLNWPLGNVVTRNFPCQIGGNGPSCGMCSHQQVGSCPVA